MNWIDKLERRYGNLGIPNLINGLLIGQLAAGIIMLFFNRDFGSLLMLSRTYVLHGQIWRLITFLFVPIWLGGVFGVLNLLFYYWLGNALARVWGDFRTTLFLALGMLGAWAFSFLTGSFAIKVSLVLGMAGFLAFYGREVFDWCVDAVKDWKRRRDWENRNR